MRNKRGQESQNIKQESVRTVGLTADPNSPSGSCGKFWYHIIWFTYRLAFIFVDGWRYTMIVTDGWNGVYGTCT
jgi:hypothetical protein